jgi:hypothetical protein
MSITLDDAREKLRWAKHHFAVIKTEIEAFEKRNDYSVSVDVDAETGTYSFQVSNLGEANPDWGLMVGDCLHNARTALDYLMIRLVALVTGDDPRDIGDIQFPVYDGGENPGKRFNGDKSVARLRENPAFRGYMARVEELQPYNNGNPSIWGATSYKINGTVIRSGNVSPIPIALHRLSVLDNLDKHRLIHATRQRSNWINNAHPDPPAGFKLRRTSTANQPLVDGATLGSWTFDTPLPCEWTPRQVDMKRHFPLHVAFDDVYGGEEAALQTLRLCIWGAEVVLDLFQPIFGEHVQPPLPVTASPSLAHDSPIGRYPAGWPATFLSHEYP